MAKSDKTRGSVCAGIFSVFRLPRVTFILVTFEGKLFWFDWLQQIRTLQIVMLVVVYTSVYSVP